MRYTLEKDIWTDADFENMGWHDTVVYKIALNKDLFLDIDYILQWNKPEVEGLSYTFWLAPATLCFLNIKNLRFDIDIVIEDAFEIEDIERKLLPDETQWTIITRQGEIQFSSNSYVLTIRQQPSFQYRQFIGYGERGGFSIDLVTDQSNDFILSETYKERRCRDADLYNHKKNFYICKLALQDLKQKRRDGEIETKDYLIQKKEITNLLEGYVLLLKGTSFELSERSW